MDAFCFRVVFNRLPQYVIENVVNDWCEPLGAIRVIANNSYSNNIYVDVKEWKPNGYAMRDKLIALRAKGKFDKAEIPQHPLKFGRYLLVLPSYTLAQHEAYVAEKVAQQVAREQALLIPAQPVFWNWSPDASFLPVAMGWDVQTEEALSFAPGSSNSSSDTVELEPAVEPQPATVEYESDEMPEIDFA
jgi:hypothetical protein